MSCLCIVVLACAAVISFLFFPSLFVCFCFFVLFCFVVVAIFVAVVPVLALFFAGATVFLLFATIAFCTAVLTVTVIATADFVVAAALLLLLLC